MSNLQESNSLVSNHLVPNLNNEVLRTIYKKKQKPNQTRILIAGNLLKRVWVDGPCDGPSWSQQTVMDSIVPYLCNFFCWSLHYPRRQV